ncbi:MAG: zinc-dependent alcohol dehydrogenase family protein [bacterium]|nr:zinc-dependent alcohol dehydrogenase family protein [bacterium]
MKAVVFEGIRNAVIQNVPIPGIGPNDVLIRVEAVGICRTDLQIYEGVHPTEFPLIPGHEFSGIVEDIGESVTTVAVGERVTADPNIGCGKCYFCKINKQNHCENLQMIGETRDGAFAEYVLVPEKNVYNIGELSFPEAAMIEPVASVAYALQQIPVQIGADVLIMGAGPRGILLMQLLKYAGASRVFMVEKFLGRAELAKSIGADVVILADGSETENLQELAGAGFDLVVDSTGVAQVAEGMLHFVRRCGTLLYFGVFSNDDAFQISPDEISRKELHLYGTFASRHTFAPAIRLLQNEVVRVEPLLSHSFTLNQFKEALDILQFGNSVKVQLLP